MGFASSFSSSSKANPAPQPKITIVSRVRAQPADDVANALRPTDPQTIATFNLYSNPTRDVVLQGAPPAIGCLFPTRRGSSASSSRRPSLLGTSPVSSASLSSFMDSGLPSTEATYPFLALLEVLRADKRFDGLDDLDVIADAGALAQIAHFQRSAHKSRCGGPASGLSNSACSASDRTSPLLSPHSPLPISSSPQSSTFLGHLHPSSITSAAAGSDHDHRSKYSASSLSVHSFSALSASASTSFSRSKSRLGGVFKKDKKPRAYSSSSSSAFSSSSRQLPVSGQIDESGDECSQLRLHALLHSNRRTLVLLSDLYALSPDSDSSSDAEDYASTERRLKDALRDLTHSPVHGSNDHRRAIRYSAGGMQYLVLFSAHASTATYDSRSPFVPVSAAPREFVNSKIDYHSIPRGFALPLEHDLLVHCAFADNSHPTLRSSSSYNDSDSSSQSQCSSVGGKARLDSYHHNWRKNTRARDEMAFMRVDKLMTISHPTSSKSGSSRSLRPAARGRHHTGVVQIDAEEAEEDTKRAAALVAPFVRMIRQELLASTTTPASRRKRNANGETQRDMGMVLIQQVDPSEVILVKDVDPLLTLRDELERFGSRPY